MSAITIDPERDIAPILNQEQAAVASIKDYLINGYTFRRASYNARFKNKSKSVPQNPGPSPQDEEFWDGIISTFLGYISEIDQRYSNMFGISKRRKRKRESSTDGGSFWIEEDLIDDFKTYFSKIEAQYLRYSRHHSQCKDLFQQLIAEIEMAISPGSPDNSDSPSGTEKTSILGRTSFRYISKMLDIHDDKICSLLPFLLTAYVYNFRNNRFMNRGTEAVEGAFSDDNVETIKVAVTKSKLNTLSECFGLFNRLIKFPASEDRQDGSPDLGSRQIEPPDSESEFIEPPCLKKDQISYSVRYSSESPSLEHRKVLDSVFAIWCGIICGICECGASKMNPTFYEKVDIVSCVKLYLYYTDNAYYQYLVSREAGFPSKEKIYQHILLCCASTPSFMPEISFRIVQEV